MMLADKYSITYYAFEPTVVEILALAAENAVPVRRTTNKASLSIRRFLPIIGYTELTVIGVPVGEDHEPVCEQPVYQPYNREELNGD